ncbi:MAG TPA: T9SS type A sorting domain-containing protein [Gammaproteobacteria bacterium]|nr:T9SS type A sorting domain-containing protein [Gammaproteobacteria bacterium]
MNATGSGTLEYSINGGTSWSTTATFSSLVPGNYNIAARLQSNPTCIISYSANPVVLTAATGCVVVCPKSQGYWKNNPSAWPASALPMMLGTSNIYTKQQLRKILNTAAGTGTKADASLILAHQLIAAKLNIAAGATAPASVSSAISAADAAIGTRLIPMNVKTNTTLGKTMTSLAKTLESFNTGQLTAGCSTLLTSSTMSNGLSVNVVPESFELEQNYPNPFSSVTTIRYVVPVESTVSLAVYNNQGQLMAKLVNGRMNAGNHQVQFDASKLAAGIYLYRLQTVDANGQVVMINKKMILSK